MSAVCWSHLLPDPLRMGRLSTDDLDAIERTAECEALTVAHGIAAIGELLAWTADARAKQKAERDAEIMRLAEEGKTQQEIAVETGVAQGTVSGVLSYQKQTVSEIDKAPANQPDANLHPAAKIEAKSDPFLEAQLSTQPGHFLTQQALQFRTLCKRA